MYGANMLSTMLDHLTSYLNDILDDKRWKKKDSVSKTILDSL